MGRYEVTGELGRGSMGIVHRAHDPVMGRDVALKTILLPNGLPDDKRDEFQQRFLREAQVAGRLSHPGIVTVYDFNKDGDGDLPYIAMELVQGSTLHDLITQEGPLKPEWVLTIGDTLADALEAAYEAGIVHRDLKPANILVREADGVAKITDFGIARINYSELTSAGTTYGSPAYMAPERIRGQQADLRSDLFSLAVILYEALCGQRPFGGDDFASICFSILNDAPTSIRTREGGLTPAFDAFFDTALAKEPQLRFQNGTEFREALEAVRHQQVLFTSGAATMLMQTPVRPRSAEAGAAEVAPASTDGAFDDCLASLATATTTHAGTEPSVLPPRPQVAWPAREHRALRLVAATAGLLLLLVGVVVFRGGEDRATTSEPSSTASAQVPPGDEPVIAHDPQTLTPRSTNNTRPADRQGSLLTPPSLSERPAGSAPARSTGKRAGAGGPPASASSPTARSTSQAQSSPAPTPPLAAPAPDAAIVTPPAALVEIASAARPQSRPLEPAILHVAIKSSVKQGQLQVLADEQEVFNSVLDTEDRTIARAYQKVVRKPQQELEAELHVPAGTRVLTVRVYSEAKSRWYEERLELELAPGASRNVEIVAGRTFGRWLTVSGG